MAETKASARSSRDSQSHDNQTRRKPWRPVRSLKLPRHPQAIPIGGSGSPCWDKKTELMSRVEFEKGGNS